MCPWILGRPAAFAGFVLLGECIWVRHLRQMDFSAQWRSTGRAA